jgi:opacity protein-like surface antigen
MKTFKRVAGVMVAAIVALGAAPGHAQLTLPRDAWRFEATPYLWLAGIKGEFGDGSLTGAPPRVDASFDSLLSRLDMAFMGTLEARRDRWSLFGDVIYLAFSDSVGIKLAPGLATPGARFDASLSGSVLSAGGTWRLSDGKTTTDLVGGLRHYSLDPSVDVTSGPVQRRLNPARDWTDPVIGFRVRQSVTDRWSLLGYADLGGFGLGSRLSYQFHAGAEYAFSKTYSGRVGYRQLRVDYEDGSTRIDLTFGGVMLGVGIRW